MRSAGFVAAAAACLIVPMAAQALAQATPSAAEAAQVSRRQTVEDLATKLVNRFVKPDVGQKYAAMLRANAAAGKYDGLTEDAAFAKQVTADIQAVSFDGHLQLVPVKKPAGASGGGGSPRGLPDTIEVQARLGDVAYIRLAKFFGESEEVAAVEKFVADNADAKTMIFDVRTHMGGGLSEMDAIFPYLFGKETVLVGMDARQGVGSPMDGGPMLRPVASPNGVVRRVHFVVPKAGSQLATAKVFVLASGRTGSAGEHFVLALKRTGRATVIGETTYGAGNFGSTEQIAGGFQAFIPVGRTFDPDTDKGWDYFGIAPNVAVPVELALVEALVRSGVARDQAEIFSAKYGPAAADVTSKRKAPASVAGI